jgi:hypothetical protein
MKNELKIETTFCMCRLAKDLMNDSDENDDDEDDEDDLSA